MAGVSHIHGRWLNPIDTPPPEPIIPTPETLKTPITGCVPRNQNTAYGRQDHLGGIVAEVHWDMLQPTPYGEIDVNATSVGSYDALKTALAIKRAGGASFPVRLRIMCGRYAPAWVKALGGGALYLCNTETPDGKNAAGVATSSEILSVPKFWKSDVELAFDDFIRKMAVLVDGMPEVVDVAVHLSTGLYAEPFQRGTRLVYASSGPNVGKSNMQVYYTAEPLLEVQKSKTGTVTGPSLIEKASIMRPFDLVTNPAGVTMTRWQSWGWNNTRMFIPFNPHQAFKVINPDPANFSYSAVTNPGSWMEPAVDLMVKHMGNRIVLGNTSIRPPIGPPDLGGGYGEMYAMLERKAAMRSYQTATIDRIVKSAATKDGTLIVNDPDSEKRAGYLTVQIGSGIITQANDTVGWLPDGVGLDHMTCRAIELWPEWQGDLTDAQLDVINAKCATNPSSYVH